MYAILMKKRAVSQRCYPHDDGIALEQKSGESVKIALTASIWTVLEQEEL